MRSLCLLLVLAVTWSQSNCQEEPLEPGFPGLIEEHLPEDLPEGLEDLIEHAKEALPGGMPPLGPVIDPLPIHLPELPDEEPLIRCKRPVCDMERCAYGLALGEDRCPICECMTRDGLCKELSCEEGTRCHVPTCEGEECALVRPRCIKECPMYKCMPCESGMYKMVDGCQTCECESMPCAIPMCAEPCELGYADDERGCMTCNCREEPPTEVKECSKAMCRMFCEYGFQKNKDGCEVCRCRDQPEVCSDIMCMMFCEYGFEKDEHGCDMCRCRDVPPGCPTFMCKRFCENGLKKDPMGCPTCECKESLIPLPEMLGCETIDCAPGMSCKEVMPLFGCDDGNCKPIPVCRPTSICEELHGRDVPEDEIGMLLQHMDPEIENMFNPGRAQCRPDGAFEPTQCVGEKCVCVDDRGVMQKLMAMMGQKSGCRPNITKTMDLMFQLEHDMDDNDLDGALVDIEKLVHEYIGDWMGLDKAVVLTVQVIYVKPGALMVQMTVVHDGLSDLASTAHHFHKQMKAGKCDFKYKNHWMKPQHETFHAEHHYEPRREPNMPSRIVKCWGYVRKHHPILIYILPVIIPLVIILIILVLCICKRRKMTASYQFQHKKMENMENFKKNLIMSSEWEKPELVCKDDVKVTLTDNIEKTPIV